ncbi:hypothetical protein F4556_003912 [Kitasatospora gansuensis]|uniref:Uncharacterized protein n=1 Tax=Kitasatospora gansuensis TaxID=258050 RepID=A0A7W7SDP4_9ACTN|nr:hypothetical protein [Kitasatospora gansuensis]MBB4948377.1 hypothetical protein [Kitasatospora gansuensis]
MEHDPLKPDPLARFWDGDVTLQAAAPAPAPVEGFPTDGLGPSGIRIGGRELSVLLAETYRRLSNPDGS